MWRSLEHLLHGLLRGNADLTREQWIGVFAAALLLGAVCLQGFGNRLRR